MTTNLFIILLIALSAFSTLLTEAIKKFAQNMKSNVSANLIALIDAIFVGGFGTVGAYVYLGITFTLSNINNLLSVAHTKRNTR